MTNRNEPPKDPTLPSVGDDIYVPSQWYMSHGHDDFEGGLVRVTKVHFSSQWKRWTIEVAERPGHGYFWDTLRNEQERLKAEYGDRRGHPDPDDHPDSNSWL